MLEQPLLTAPDAMFFPAVSFTDKFGLLPSWLLVTAAAQLLRRWTLSTRSYGIVRTGAPLRCVELTFFFPIIIFASYCPFPSGIGQVKVKPGGARVTSWDFDELRELLAHHPSMSVCFHAALARAMASKLVDTHNPAVKYRQLLTVRLLFFVAVARCSLLPLKRAPTVETRAYQ